MLARRFAAAALAALLLGGACWFETTPPERDEPPVVPVDPNEVVLTGLVQFFDRTDHHTRPAVGWLVTVTWLGPDKNGDGQPDALDAWILRAGSAGVYETRFNSRTVIAAEVRGARCDYDPVAADCCLDIPPCDPRNCQIWGSARRLNVVPGQRYQQDVVVGCDHAP